MDDTPRPDDEKTRTELQAALVKAMSPAARRAYKESPKALRYEHIYKLFDRQGYDIITGDANFVKVAKPWLDKENQRQEAQQRLESIVNGCKTLKQLRQLLPEFEKYMPTEDAPGKNLPVVANVVSDLTRLGWPRQQAKARRKAATPAPVAPGA